MQITWEQAKDWIGKGAATLALIHAGMEAYEAFSKELEDRESQD